MNELTQKESLWLKAQSVLECYLDERDNSEKRELLVEFAEIERRLREKGRDGRDGDILTPVVGVETDHDAGAVLSPAPAFADPSEVAHGAVLPEILVLASLCMRGVLSFEEFDDLVERIVQSNRSTSADPNDGFMDLIVSGKMDAIERRITDTPEVMRVVTGTGHWTPLHIAVSTGRHGVIELLLTHGADANAESARGKTALHIAASRGDHNAMAMLLTHGADAFAVYKGRTPLDRAVAGDHDAAVKLLESYERVQDEF